MRRFRERIAPVAVGATRDLIADLLERHGGSPVPSRGMAGCYLIRVRRDPWHFRAVVDATGAVLTVLPSGDSNRGRESQRRKRERRIE